MSDTVAALWLSIGGAFTVALAIHRLRRPQWGESTEWRRRRLLTWFIFQYYRPLTRRYTDTEARAGAVFQLALGLIMLMFGILILTRVLL